MKKERFCEILFWGLSILLVILAIYAYIHKEQMNVIGTAIALGCITNPFFLNKLSLKMGNNKPDYWYGTRTFFTWFGIFLAYVVAVCVFYSVKTSLTFQDVEAILKMAVFIIYFLVLFMYNDTDKFIKYLFFGVIYIISVLLSFSSISINNFIAQILKTDIQVYGMLVNDFVMPIKEAILTYIIFDTVFSEKIKKPAIESKTFQVDLLNLESGGTNRYNVKLKEE